MLRRFVTATPSRSLLLSQLRFCTTKQPSDAENSILAKCIELDTKCSAWSLTQQDCSDALAMLAELVSGKTPVPPIKSLMDIIQYRDHELPNSPTFLPRIVQVPYVISALYRVIFSYPDWETLMQIPQIAGRGDVERFSLRTKSSPSRELLGKAYVCSLPMDPENMFKQYFVVGFPQKDLFKHIIDQGQNDEHGKLAASKIAGYELFKFVERTPLVKNTVQQMRKKSDVKKHEQQQHGSVKPQEEYTFEGIVVNTGSNNEETTIIANTPDTLLMAKRLADEAAVETSLVLTKAILEDDMAYTIDPENFLYQQTRYSRLVANMVAIVSGDTSYYILQNAKGGSMIFTSMHHLHRFRKASVENDPNRWEEFGPWKVGAGGDIQLFDFDDAKAEFSHVINPTAIADEASHDSQRGGSVFPGFDVRFNRKTMETLKKMADLKKKEELKRMNSAPKKM